MKRHMLSASAEALIEAVTLVMDVQKKFYNHKLKILIIVLLQES